MAIKRRFLHLKVCLSGPSTIELAQTQMLYHCGKWVAGFMDDEGIKNLTRQGAAVSVLGLRYCVKTELECNSTPNNVTSFLTFFLPFLRDEEQWDCNRALS